MNSIVDTITMIFIVKDTFYLLNHAASFQTEKMNHLFTKEKNKRFFFEEFDFLISFTLNARNFSFALKISACEYYNNYYKFIPFG